MYELCYYIEMIEYNNIMKIIRQYSENVTNYSRNENK